MDKDQTTYLQWLKRREEARMNTNYYVSDSREIKRSIDAAIYHFIGEAPDIDFPEWSLDDGEGQLTWHVFVEKDDEGNAVISNRSYDGMSEDECYKFIQALTEARLWASTYNNYESECD